MKLDQYIELLIEREGGYVNHSKDKGGPTSFGITERVARAFGYTGSMEEMPRLKARAIYKERYWFQPRFNFINDIHPELAEEMLDTGVNMGTGTAVKFLQRALNVLNMHGRHYPDIEVDGAIGRMTVAALRELYQRRGDAGKAIMLRMMNAQQSVRYMEIAERDPDQEEFQFGWQFNRVS